MNELQETLFERTRRRLPLIHTLLCSAGLFSAAAAVAPFAAGVLLPPLAVAPLDQHLPFYCPEKRPVLLWWVLACAFLTVYFMGALFARRWRRESPGVLVSWLDRPWKLWTYLACGILVNAPMIWIPLLAASHNARLVYCPLWFVFWTVPLLPVAEAGGVWALKRSRWLLALGLIEAGLVFLPFIVGPPRVLNEFYDLPESTILKAEGSAQSVVVDNHSYINERNLLGRPKYDPRTDMGGEPSSPFSVRIDGSPNLIAWLKEHRLVVDMNRIGTAGHWEKPQVGEIGGNFCYDAKRESLVAIGPVSVEEFGILGRYAADSDRNALAQWYLTVTKAFPERSRQSYSDMDMSFIHRNHFEQCRQAESRYLFHHHNFLLGAVSELDLKRPLNEINAQYGFLNLYALKGLLHIFGGINWQVYQKLMFSFYYLYLALAFVLFYAITRDVRLLALFVLGSVAAYMLVNYQFLQLAPGINPMRHFFDLTVLFLVYLHTRRQSWVCMGAVWVGVALALLNNTMCGLFLAVSVAIALAMERLTQDRPRLLGLANEALLLAVALLTALLLHPTRDSLTPYYLGGLLAFPLTLPLITALCVLIIVLLATVSLCWDRIERTYRVLLLTSTLYSMGLAFYYVWGGTFPHLLNFSVVFIFTALIYTKVLLDIAAQSPALARQSSRILVLALALTLAINAAGALSYLKNAVSIQRVFAHHVNYTWTNPRARVVTTTPEGTFNQAVDLIHRYSKDPGISIISKYDCILPFLAERYSAMPYPDLQWFIVTPREIAEVARYVGEKKPEYLFVDTDIDRAFRRDEIRHDVPRWLDCREESLMRVMRLQTLRITFDQVRGQYRLVERTPIISVWKRMEPSASTPPAPSGR